MTEFETKSDATTAVVTTIGRSRKNIESFLSALATVLQVGDYKELAYSVGEESWQGSVESAKVQLDERTTLEVRMIRTK